jgi:hypothetical protein
MNNFYIYIYLDPKNIPFYVGKGKGYRYYILSHLGKRYSNRLLKNKILKLGVDNIQIKFLQKGHSVSKETKKKISEMLKGHSVSEEAKQKIGEANKGRRKKEIYAEGNLDQN